MNSYIESINTFLYYGYLPDPHVHLPASLKLWFNGHLHGSDYSSLPKSEIIRIGVSILRDCFKEEISNVYNESHVLPLSGGLDSRTILANLLEYLEPAKIITVTFGVPGSPDYEMAQLIAKKAGVKWEGIDLSPGKWNWNTDLLIDTAKRGERPTGLFDNAVNHAIRIKYGDKCIYWSGLMGDPLARINPLSYNVKTWEQAKTVFAIKNCKSKTYKLSNPDFNPKTCLPKQSYTDADRLDYYSQLYYCIRQLCLIQHIYSPKGYRILHPFLHPKWLTFILSVPVHYRHHQILYRRIQETSWPHLFNKQNSPFRDSPIYYDLIHGRKRYFLRKIIKKALPKKFNSFLGADKNVNYIDWNYALRYQDDLNYMIYSNLHDLKARKIIDWLNIDKLWAYHQNTEINLAKELMTLAALEIHLKTKTLA